MGPVSRESRFRFASKVRAVLAIHTIGKPQLATRMTKWQFELKLRAAIGALVMLAAFAMSEAAVAGELASRALESAVLKRTMTYLVYLPDGYELSSSRRYPVLYLLHGAGGDETTWISRGNIKERIDKLIANGAIPPAILIIPGCVDCWWVDGQKDKAETAFWTELVPAVDDRYRTIAARQGRLIAGVSAGGYGAVRYGLKYPDQIAAVAAFSPAIYATTPPALSAARRQSPFVRTDGQFNQSLWSAENYPRLVERYFGQKDQVGFYLVAGDSDRLGITFETALLFKTIFEKQPDLAELRVVDGGHDWDVWGSTMDDALKYLFLFTPRPHDGMH